MRSGSENVTVKLRSMANGMTTGTIGTTAEKDKTRSSVLLVRIQYLETCKKNITTTTKQNETHMHFSTPQYCMQKINTILHTDKYYYRYREPT